MKKFDVGNNLIEKCNEPVVVQEERVVAERRHGDSDLAKVVKILKNGNLAKEEAVSDRFGHHEAGNLQTELRELSISILFSGSSNGNYSLRRKSLR